MNTKALGMIAGALLVMASLVSSAAELPAPFEGSSTLQADGIVKSVDPARHQVTVIDPRGSEASFTVTEAGNLAQIRQGAKVHVRMMRNATISVTRGVKGGAAAPAVHMGTTNATAADSASLQNVTADIQTIDHASGVIALKGANGAVFHIQSRDPARLAAVREGMQVAIAFAPQVSVAVAPVQ